MNPIRFKKIISYLLLTIPLAFLTFSFAFASGSNFDATACNMLNIVTGNGGKIFASFAVVSVGIGFFSGKISWGLLIGVTAGVAVMFGAPSIVSALSGSDLSECESGVVYVTSCEGNSCFSCPRGFAGDDCDRCSAGFEGAQCDTCKEGYTGFNCNECDGLNGYSGFNGYCYKGCSVNIKGVPPATSVLPGASSINCTESGFKGKVSYVCENEVFTPNSGQSCQCVGNRTGENCNECLTGYDLSTNCSQCLSGYSLVSGRCQQDCSISIAGIINSNALSPEAGILGCLQTGYTGTINYSCVDGNFGYTGACSCAVGYTGPITNCAQSCDTANGYKNIGGECLKGCAISVNGVSETFVNEASSSASLACDADNYTGSINYTCLANNFTKSGDCQCEEGRSLSSNCASCDEENGYKMMSGECVQGCVVDIAGVSETWVPITDSSSSTTTEFTCSETGYYDTIEYTCSAGGNLSVTPDKCPNKCSGGTESEFTVGSTNYILHLFTSGTTSFSCVEDKEVKYLVVAGGGGGGNRHGGGGGAGGMLEGNTTLTANQSYTITVGSGGGSGSNGSNSSISTIATAIGGGRGGNNASGGSGGSGGGGSNNGMGGSGTSGQGNKGGDTTGGCCFGRGTGGGGAGGAGIASLGSNPSDGGSGKASSITGTSTYYAGGGGGGSWILLSDGNSQGFGGSAIGGTGGNRDNMNGTNGVANTGSGGGGGGANGSSSGSAGSGGSGIVVIRYVK